MGSFVIVVPREIQPLPVQFRAVFCAKAWPDHQLPSLLLGYPDLIPQLLASRHIAALSCFETRRWRSDGSIIVFRPDLRAILLLILRDQLFFKAFKLLLIRHRYLTLL